MAKGECSAPSNNWNMCLKEEKKPTENPGPPGWELDVRPINSSFKTLELQKLESRCIQATMSEEQRHAGPQTMPLVAGSTDV